MYEYSAVASLSAIDRDAWNNCFQEELENYDYLLAVEEAGLPGFSWRYLIARDAEGTILAAAPMFITSYGLDTTLAGSARRLAERLRRLAPDLLTLRLACIGSPCTEQALLGFLPAVEEHSRHDLFKGLVGALEQVAEQEHCGLIAFKDVDDSFITCFDETLRSLGYRAIDSQPSAHLNIDFANLDSYLSCLSAATRKDMRRKIKAFDRVRVDIRTDIYGYEEEVLRLYRDTRARAEMTFEDLTAAYFSGVLARLPGRALCVLYFVGDALLAANLLIMNNTALLDKFFVMDSARGRAHNLYYLSWFTNIRLCLDRGLREYRSGQAGYNNKIRLGSRLTRNHLYFRHRNAVVNGLLHLAAPLLSPRYGLAEAA